MMQPGSLKVRTKGRRPAEKHVAFTGVGEQLREARQAKRVSLEELSQTTRIPLRTLRSLEAEAFDQLPGEVFVRGFLRACARALGLPAEHWTREAGTHLSAEPGSNPAALVSVTAPERGRRFGVAIALVVLVILFTLALSIVLRPRFVEGPGELSLAPSAAFRA